MDTSLCGRKGSVLAAIPLVISPGFLHWVDHSIGVCKHISLKDSTHVRYSQVYRDYCILARRTDPRVTLPHEPRGSFDAVNVERMLFINFISRSPPSSHLLAGVLSALRDCAKRFRCLPFLEGGK